MEYLSAVENEFVTQIPGSEKMYRHGTGQAKIRGLQVLNSKGLPTQLVAFGEDVTFRFYVEYLEDLPQSGIGFYIRDLYGIEIVGVNTFEEGKPFGNRRKGDRFPVRRSACRRPIRRTGYRSPVPR